MYTLCSILFVLVSKLSTTQFERRQSGAFPRQFEYIENKTLRVPSFMKFIYRNFLLELSEKLKIDQSILDFDLIRLKEMTRQCVLHRHASHPADANPNMAYHMHEWPMALEIFLQIDRKYILFLSIHFLFCSFSVDSLFMKTCSFRGSHPRSTSDGLFCLDPPDTRYLMLPCTNSLCPCCYQSLDISRRHEPSVRFASEQAHQFVNGYQVYLNCHAVRSFFFILIEIYFRLVKQPVLFMFLLVLVVNLILLVVVIIPMHHSKMFSSVR